MIRREAQKEITPFSKESGNKVRLINAVKSKCRRIGAEN